MNGIVLKGAPESPTAEPAIDLNLQPADILLVHTKYSLWSRLIRWATHCYWNHALLVYSPAEPEQGKMSPLVIDAKTNGKIALGKADFYLRQPDKYDLAVLRFEADWFQPGSGAGELDLPGRICNLAANEVEFRLGSNLGETVDQLLRQSTLIWRFVRRKLFGPRPAPKLPWDLRLTDFKAFTCAGFVQWCYYKAASRTAAAPERGDARLRQVLFNPRIRDDITPFGLLTTTPADLAACQKLIWKYTQIGGHLVDLSLPRDTDKLSVDAVIGGSWLAETENRAAACNQRLSAREQRDFSLELLPRLAKRVDSFSEGCGECRSLQGEINRMSLLVSSQPVLNGNGRREYSTALARVTGHLNREHRLVVERHYVKRFVSVAASVGLGLVGLGFLLVYFGITAVVLTIAIPALLGRMAFGYLLGSFMDRRARNRGVVI